MPHLDQIFVYPIKSLDGVAVDQATILTGGSLKYDREFAIVDAQGKFINGKRTAKVHHLRTSFDLNARTITIRVEGQSHTQTFHLDRDRPSLEIWLSDYFGEPITLQQNLHMGFPDDPIASGPTVVSTATLEAIATWFPGLTLDNVRKRFRTNLEIGGVPAFWEDRLFAEAEQRVPFQIGQVTLYGTNPCQRCIVPTRDPVAGDRLPNFQKTFVTKRQETLPTWTPTARFDHFYKLTVNTMVHSSEAGKQLAVGNEIAVIPPCAQS